VGRTFYPPPKRALLLFPLRLLENLHFYLFYRASQSRAGPLPSVTGERFVLSRSHFRNRTTFSFFGRRSSFSSFVHSGLFTVHRRARAWVKFPEWKSSPFRPMPRIFPPLFVESSSALWNSGAFGGIPSALSFPPSPPSTICMVEAFFFTIESLRERRPQSLCTSSVLPPPSGRRVDSLGRGTAPLQWRLQPTFLQRGTVFYFLTSLSKGKKSVRSFG